MFYRRQKPNCLQRRKSESHLWKKKKMYLANFDVLKCRFKCRYYKHNDFGFDYASRSSIHFLFSLYHRVWRINSCLSTLDGNDISRGWGARERWNNKFHSCETFFRNPYSRNKLRMNNRAVGADNFSRLIIMIMIARAQMVHKKYKRVKYISTRGGTAQMWRDAAYQIFLYLTQV